MIRDWIAMPLESQTNVHSSGSMKDSLIKILRKTTQKEREKTPCSLVPMYTVMHRWESRPYACLHEEGIESRKRKAR